MTSNDDKPTGAPQGDPEHSGEQPQQRLRAQQAEAEEREQLLQRRRFLQASIGVTVAVTVTGLSALTVTGSLRPIAKITPQQEPPEEGDQLVSALEQSKLVTPDDIVEGKPQTMWYPKNPKTGLVKNGTDFNLVLLARFKPGELGPDTAPHAAEGIVGYSAVCTHLCCTVSDWDAKNAWFLCPCHHSQFDPRADGKVMAGPAPRALPLLPLKLVAGQLTVAGGFITKVGCS